MRYGKQLRGGKAAGRVLAAVVTLSIFSMKASAQTYLFNRADFTAGTGPSAVAVGDFNSDGRLDVAVANAGAKTVSILLGKPDGTLQPPVDYAVGSNPVAVTVGDFNGDGKLDVAVANQADSTVSLLLGNGDGTFQGQKTIGVGCQPTSLASADFNADGNADLVVANSNDNTLSILLGNGDGTFQPQSVIQTGSQSVAVTVADFNGDGKMDVATQHAVFLGHGDGTFEALPPFNPGVGNPVAVAAGDFNGDHFPDLAIASSAQGSISVLLNDGKGTMTLASNQASVPGAATGIVAADFNGDGKVDLAVTNSFVSQGTPLPSNAVSILLGNGDGSFQTNVDYTAGGKPIAVAAGDFNGDGKPDVVVANNLSNTVSVLVNNGSGAFSPRLDTATGAQSVAAVTGDFNNDGKLDVALVNAQDNTVSIVLGNGDGTFNVGANIPAGSGPTALVAGDFNKDGKLDLAVANQCGNDPTCSSPGTILILLGNGDGTFSQPAGSPYPTAASANALTVADFDGDGNLDLAVADGPVSILFGNGDGTFQSFINYPSNGQANSIVAGDFNGDGMTDIAVTNLQGNSVSILINSGARNFTTSSPIPAGALPFGIATGDFNGDGHLDLAVANNVNFQGGAATTPGTVTVLLGDGRGTFPTSAAYPSSFSPEGVAVGDFNGDGKLDLATADLKGTILLGNGDGSFRPPLEYATAGKGYGVMAGDFAGTGRQGVAFVVAPDPISVYASTPLVAFFPSSLNFTGVGAPTQTVTVSNASVTALTISGVATTAPFSQSNTCSAAPATLAPGANCTVTVTYTPTSGGAATGTLTFTDNAPGGPQTLALTGNAPGVGVSPTSLTFSGQGLGTTSPAQTITMSNSGTAPLTVSSINASGDFAETGAQTNGCAATPFTLAAGASCVLNAMFTPTATGIRTGSITITDNALASPQTVTLTGAGTGATANLSSTSLTFSSPVGTTSSAQTVTLTNNGDVALTVNSVTASASFQASSCPQSIKPRASCMINVTFVPTAAGAASGTLTVTSNALGGPQTATLSGMGSDYSFSDNPTLSAPIVAGQSAAFPLTITPVGGFAQLISLSCTAPSQASCSVSPASVTPNGTSATMATVTVGTSESTPGGGPYTLALTGTSAVNHSASVAFHVTNYALSTSLTSTSVTAGHSTTFDVSLMPQGGFNEKVTLACSGAPTNATCSVAPNSLAVNGTSAATARVTVTTASSTPGGTYTLALNANGGVAHSSPVTLNVENFSFSVSSQSQSVSPGETAIYTLDVTGGGGFDQAISLSCGDAPSEATCSVSPASVTPTGSTASKFTVTVSTTAASATGPGGRHQDPPPSGRWPIVVLLASAAALLGALASRPQRGLGRMAPAFCALTLLVMLWASCGGGGGSISVGGGNPGTPAGTYSLTVSGTSGSGSTTLTQSVRLTLAVK